MSDQGMALMGIGRAAGEKRAVEAAHMAVSSPLLEDVSVEGATGILVNVTGGPSLTLHEVNSAIALITDVAHEDANVIFGYVVDENLGDEVAITVIATGFDRAASRLEHTDPEPAQADLPVSAHQRADPDVPTYIRKGWRQGTARQNEIEKARRGAVISMLPPVEEDTTPGPVPQMPAPEPRPQAAAARAVQSDFHEVLEEDEYDIPAFLRRNAE
jgi:cell division protein FtsZ